jgi:hypothetical protein|tara:strand:- start:505 stop:846 length:342 start_codon:yes stop_codon:yes gene_type:complete
MANSFINKKKDLTTTDDTTLYTVPTASAAIIKSLLACNDAGSACTLTVTITDTASNVFKVYNLKSIDSNATTELLDKPLILQESEVLKVQAGDANELHVIASIMEVKPREVTT